MEEQTVVSVLLRSGASVEALSRTPPVLTQAGYTPWELAIATGNTAAVAQLFQYAVLVE